MRGERERRRWFRFDEPRAVWAAFDRFASCLSLNVCRDVKDVDKKREREKKRKKLVSNSQRLRAWKITSQLSYDNSTPIPHKRWGKIERKKKWSSISHLFTHTRHKNSSIFFFSYFAYLLWEKNRITKKKQKTHTNFTPKNRNWLQ